MARLLKQSEAKRLELPGRISLELISGAIGSKMTFRIVEIPVAKWGDKPRGPHRHRGFEECIHVLKGRGVLEADSGDLRLSPGDTVLVPPNEKHMTVNTGPEPMILLCFFPEPNVAARTDEFPPLKAKVRE